MGDGDYMVRYSTYRTGTLPYSITSEIAGFPVQNGQITISDKSPRTRQEADYAVGGHWYGDKWGEENRWNGHRGAMTVFRWRRDAMEDWGRRCRWLGGRQRIEKKNDGRETDTGRVSVSRLTLRGGMVRRRFTQAC